jgi:hypothetical protein
MRSSYITVGKPGGKDYLKDLSIDGRILKCVTRKMFEGCGLNLPGAWHGPWKSLLNT